MTDDELVALCRSEYAAADTHNSALEGQRERNMQFYLGLPMGNEVEGRSQVISTDVADVVEAMMPPLLRIFAQSEDAVEFEPELYDTEGAEQATQYARHVFFKDNNGFQILHDQIKDGLLQKMGVVRWRWEERKVTREHRYDGLSLDEATVVIEQLAGPKKEVEVVEQEEVESAVGPLHNLKIRVTEEQGRVVVENIEPENVRIRQDLREMNDECRYVGFVTRETRSALIERGFDRDVVMTLPKFGDDDDLDEEETRWGDIGGTNGELNDAVDPLSEEVEVIEQFVVCDRDGDGVAERRLVIVSGGKLLYDERHDSLDACLFTPIRVPHRAVGRCPADQAYEIQRIQTALLRGVLDNMYAVNNGRVVARVHGKEGVNLDDLLTVRPNSVVRTKGTPSQDVMPLQTPWIGDKAKVIIDHMKTVREERTGVTNYTLGLDGDQLHDTATGFQGLTERSDERIELIARVYAETALKPIFYGIINLVARHQDTPRQIRINGQPIEIDPTQWAEAYSVTCNVGLGTGRKDKQIAALSAVIQKQEALMQAGSPLVDMELYHNALSMLVRKTDLYDPGLFFHDPSTPEFQQRLAMMQQGKQPQIDPLVQAEMIKAQSKEKEAAARMQLDAQKAEHEQAMEEADRQLEHLEKMTEMELKYGRDVPGSAV